MIRWGINALNHGSSLAVFKDDQLIFNKFDPTDELSASTLDLARSVGNPDEIYWYEQPWIKKLRQLRAGQYQRAFDLSVLPNRYLQNINIDSTSIRYTPHHASHAAAGYYTSPFEHCTILVLDAIGEFECASIWEGKNNRIYKLWSRNYPNSLGLFYSAFTDLLGFVPIQEEHKVQKLSKQGDCDRFYKEVSSYFVDKDTLKLKTNLHRGVKDWPYSIDEKDRADIAAAVQRVFEEQVDWITNTALWFINTDNLVYMGGCAMNSQANKLIVEPKFKNIWSLPQPGDPSSSIGAVLYHTQKRITNFDFGIVKHIKISV